MRGTVALLLGVFLCIATLAAAAPASPGPTGADPSGPHGLSPSKAPAADAEADAPEGPSALEQTAAALADAAAAVAAGAAHAAEAVGAGLAAATDAVGAALVALGEGIAALAGALVDGLAAVGSGLAWAALAVGDLLAYLGAALWSGLVALGDLLALVAATVGGFLHHAATDPGARPYALATAGGAGGAMMAYALWRYLSGVGAFAALYSRIGSRDILQNEARARVFEHIRANPGAHVSAIAEALDLGWGTTVYHLQKLKSVGLIAEKRGGNHKCFFVNGDLSQDEQRATAALKHAKAQQILDYLRARPTASQKDVGEALGLSAALVSWHVQRLVDAGVIAKTRTGKVTALTVRAEPVHAEPLAA